MYQAKLSQMKQIQPREENIVVYNYKKVKWHITFFIYFQSNLSVHVAQVQVIIYYYNILISILPTPLKNCIVMAYQLWLKLKMDLHRFIPSF